MKKIVAAAARRASARRHTQRLGRAVERAELLLPPTLLLAPLRERRGVGEGSRKGVRPLGFEAPKLEDAAAHRRGGPSNLLRDGQLGLPAPRLGRRLLRAERAV